MSPATEVLASVDLDQLCINTPSARSQSTRCRGQVRTPGHAHGAGAARLHDLESRAAPPIRGSKYMAGPRSIVVLYTEVSG